MSYGSFFNPRNGTTTTYFEEIKRKKTIKRNCSVCNKARTRTISASMTINPFNKNNDGQVKNRSEVDDDVTAKLEKYIKQFNSEEFICSSCTKEANNEQG